MAGSELEAKILGLIVTAGRIREQAERAPTNAERAKGIADADKLQREANALKEEMRK